MTEEGGFPALTVGVCVLLIGSLVAGIAPAAATTQSDLLTIDGEHPLTGATAVDQFEAGQNVSGTTPQVDLTLTVAHTSEGAGLDGLRIDSTRTYLRLDYDEEITRTIRIHLPSDYFTPRPKEGLEAVGSRHTADFEPVQGGEATAVTVRVDGPTDAVFAVSKASGAVFEGRRWVQEKVENGTGFSLPSLSTTAEWDYVQSSAYGSNTTVGLPYNDSLTMQYRTTTSDGTVRWIPVPNCDDPSSQAVCSFVTASGNETRLVTARESPPRVRYRYQRTLLGNLEGIANDLAAIPDRIDTWMSEVFG